MTPALAIKNVFSREQLRLHGPWLLVLSFLVLLPTKNVFNIPFALMAIGGLVVWRTQPEVLRGTQFKLLLVLFLCIWVPMVLALPDAFNVQHAAITTFKQLRFPLAGIFVLWALRSPNARRYFYYGVVGVLFLWCFDALWQFIFGHNLLGYPRSASRLQGIFYPKWRLGIVLAAFSPLYFEAVRRQPWPIAARWLIVLMLPMVVFLSGSRSSWLMLAVSVCGYGAYLFWWRRLRPTLSTLAALVCLLLAAGIAVTNYPGFKSRLERTLGLLEVSGETADLATAYRLSIWKPALNMISAHWLNGIGPRGFRYAFTSHAAPENFWMKQKPPGVTHPHMLILEITAEAGAIGFVGFLLFAIVIARASRSDEEEGWRTPLAICILVSMFPLNAHMAFYASFWGSVSWWIIFLFVASTGPQSNET